MGDEGPNLQVDEKKLLRKLDLHLIPLVMLLYTFSFLDRVNIGNARLYHLEEDLGLTPEQFQIAVSILFVTYLVFEIPSNLVLKPFGPQRWLAFIAFVWGILALCTGFVRNFGELVALRVLLGVFEAGLFPGLNVYLTFFYTKRELALRVGYLFVSAAVAGALGGLLAYGIGHLDGARGMSGWRWIMILEGIPSILLGVVTLFFLPNDPDHAYFLTPEEKKFMATRNQAHYGFTAKAEKFSKEDMMKAFKDWKVWLFCINQFGSDTMLYGFSTFLPTIIKGLGSWSPAEVQLLTIPCYGLGAITYMTIASISDRQQKRGLFCVIFGIISIVGYALLVADVPESVHYFACFLIATGLYVLVGLPLAWVPNNCPRYGKRTTAIGMQLTMGNASGILVSFIYGSKDAPRYIKGNAVSLSMVAVATFSCAVAWFWYARENDRRDKGLVKPEHENLSEDDSMSIYSFLIAVRSDGQQLTNESGDTTSHLMGMFYRTLRMIDNGIKPLYVFDGAPPKLKSGELAKRFQRKAEANADLEEAKETGTAEDVEKFSRRTVRVTREHNAECQQLLKLMGVPYIIAPTEAEAQCAVLARAGKVYAAASEDMDTLCFDSPILLRHLTFSEQRKEPIQEIAVDRVLEGLRMDRTQFVDLCILLGCDYLDPIPKIGPSTALKLMRDHGTLEKVVEYIENDPKKKYTLPEDWPYKDARALFFEPDVRKADDPLCDFKWEKPDTEGLVKFLCTDKGFNEDRVRAGAARLEKGSKSSQQARLEGFFKPVPKTDEERAALKRKHEEQNEAKKKKLKEEKKEKAKVKGRPRGAA
ncbi:DNA-repair protein rad2 [Poronia punctata]|nr:DNA-repair protein rad2 [Poronia punctata]